MTVTSNSITEEDILLKQGDDAEIILDNPAFSNIVNSIVDASFQTFSNTKPEDTSARERAYNHYRAIVDIVNTLQQRVQVRDQILAAQDDNNLTKGDE